MLLVPIPWAKRVWALPFFTALCPSECYHQGQGRSHLTLTDRARQVIRLTRRWLPQRRVVVVADSSFAALVFLHSVRAAVTMVTRLRLDAAPLARHPRVSPASGAAPVRKDSGFPRSSPS